MRSLFHLAFHVRDLDAARRFYGGVLGCTEGRSAATWVDFDFFGHQLSLHLGEPIATTNTAPNAGETECSQCAWLSIHPLIAGSVTSISPATQPKILRDRYFRRR